MSDHSKRVFGPEFFLEPLRGQHRLKNRKVVAILTDRCQWLLSRIEERRKEGRDIYGYPHEELKAVAQAMEAYQQSVHLHRL